MLSLQQQDPASSLGVLQLRCILRALGLPTDGLRSALAQRVREARASGLLLRFVEEKKRAAASSGSPQCGEKQYHLVPVVIIFCVVDAAVFLGICSGDVSF